MLHGFTMNKFFALLTGAIAAALIPHQVATSYMADMDNYIPTEESSKYFGIESHGQEQGYHSYEDQSYGIDSHESQEGQLYPSYEDQSSQNYGIQEEQGHQSYEDLSSQNYRVQSHGIQEQGHQSYGGHSYQPEPVQVHASQGLKYKYRYSVHDPQTGDVKTQEEQKDARGVQGYYKLHTPHGGERSVEYYDHGHGFVAKVRTSKIEHPVSHPKNKY